MKLMQTYHISDLEIEGLKLSHVPGLLTPNTNQDIPEEIPQQDSPPSEFDLEQALHNLGRDIQNG